MSSRIKLTIRVLAVGAALAAIWYFAGPLIAQLFRGTVALLSFLVSVFFLPAVLFVLGWFAYSVFLKKYLRARRISRIRDARYMRDAVERNHRERQTED